MKPKYSKQRRNTSMEKLEKDSVETQDGREEMSSQYETSISSRAKHTADNEENEGFIGSARKSSNRNQSTHRQSGQRKTEAFVANASDNKVTKEIRRNSMESSRTILHGESFHKKHVDGLKISNSTKEDKNKTKTALQTEETYGVEGDELTRKDNSISRLRKETQMNEIPKTLPSGVSIDVDQLTADMYRTLVRVKGENLTLKDVADVMKEYLHIQITKENLEDFLFIFEQREDLFTVAFDVRETLISPRTNIEVCSIFTSDTCKEHECSNLHICKYFLLSKCPIKKCKFGHYLRSSHNSRVLLNFGLDGLEQGCILTLIRNIGSRNSSTLPLLCKFYNNEGNCSKGNKCRHLHLCKHFINEDCKFRKKCLRCHNLLAKQPMSVLKRYGLTPDSFNYTRIMCLIKGTLQHGGVLLKREIQSINPLQKVQSTSDEESELNDTSDSSQSEDGKSAETYDSEKDNSGKDCSKNDGLEREHLGRDGSEGEHLRSGRLKRDHSETDHLEREHLGRGHSKRDYLEIEHTGRGRSSERKYSDRHGAEIEHSGRGCSKGDRSERGRSEIEHLERDQPGRDRVERKHYGRDRSGRELKGRGHSERERLEREQSERNRSEREHSGRDCSGRELNGRGRSEQEHLESKHSGRDHLERKHSGRDCSGRELKGRGRSERERLEREHSERNCSERKHSGRDCSGRELNARGRSEREHFESKHSGRDHLEREHSGRDRSGRELKGKGRSEREHLEREHSERDHSEEDRLERGHQGGHRSERDHTEREIRGKGLSERDFSERDLPDRKHSGRELSERDRPERNFTGQFDNNSTSCGDNKHGQPELLVMSGEVSCLRTDINLTDKGMVSVKATGKLDKVKVDAAENIIQNVEIQSVFKYNAIRRRYNGNDKQLCTNKISDRAVTDAQTQERAISLISFQLPEKVFRIRNINGRWQLADLSDTWADIRDNEADEFLKLKDDFIRLAEKIVSKAHEETVGHEEA